MDPKPTEPNVVDKFNQLVRAIVTLGLTAGFCWLAFVKEIDSAVFATTYSIIVTFWFVQKQTETAAKDAAKQATNGSPPAPAQAVEPAKVP